MEKHDTTNKPTYQLSVKNFQSIKNQTVSFSGFNVICGKSDMGKSALRRSIQTVLFNNWSKSFIRSGEKSTLITLTKQQDNKTEFSISALKSSTDNQFVINNQTYPKMGKDAPSIPDHNFRQDLNIATQLEPLYMVSYKDTENTKILNNLFGIDILEQAQYLCQLDLRRTKQDNKYKTEQLNLKEQEHEKTQKQYQALNDILTKHKDTQSQITHLNQYTTQQSQYLKLKQEHIGIQRKLTHMQSKLDILKQYITLKDYVKLSRTYKRLDIQNISTEKLLETISTYSTKLHNLNEYIHGSYKLNKAMEQHSISQYRYRRIQGIATNLETLLEYTRAYETYNKLKSNPKLSISFKSVQGISKLLEYYRLRTSNNLASKQMRMQEIAEQLSNIELEVSKYKCPTCGNTITTHIGTHSNLT